MDFRNFENVVETGVVKEQEGDLFTYMKVGQLERRSVDFTCIKVGQIERSKVNFLPT